MKSRGLKDEQVDPTNQVAMRAFYTNQVIHVDDEMTWKASLGPETRWALMEELRYTHQCEYGKQIERQRRSCMNVCLTHATVYDRLAHLLEVTFEARSKGKRSVAWINEVKWEFGYRILLYRPFVLQAITNVYDESW